MAMPSFFGRRRDPAVAIRDLAMSALRRHEVIVTVEPGPDGDELVMSESDARFFLGNLVERARATPRREWRALTDTWVEGVIDAISQPEVEDLTAGQWQAQVRTRLFAEGSYDLDLSYAEPFAPGVVLGLCVDSPRSTQIVTSELLESAPVGAEDLFRIGQANTDAEPIDEHGTLGDHVQILEGDSFYVAARAANYAALMPDVIGPAPYGAAFAVPNRHTLLYAILTPETMIDAVSELAQATDRLCHDEDQFHPGGVISDRTFYWAPDGTVEDLAGTTDRDGEPTLVVTPGEQFLAHLDPDA